MRREAVLHDVVHFVHAVLCIAGGRGAGGAGRAAVITAAAATAAAAGAAAGAVDRVLVRPQTVPDLGQRLVVLVVSSGHLAAARGLLPEAGTALAKVRPELGVGELAVGFQVIFTKVA